MCANHNLALPLRKLARVRWLDVELSREQLRQLYYSSNAFVLPTRGEGWGLPCVEAMACGLPPIVTNFSGPTHYMSPERGWPVLVHDTLNADGTAEPRGDSLQRAMAEAVSDRGGAAAKGRAAQAWVSEHLHPDVLAQQIVSHLKEKVHNTKH